MKEYKSNMSGVDLYTHSKAVQKIGLMMFDICVNKELNDKDNLKDCVSKACLLHDIGKVSDLFNYYIETNLEHPDFKKYKLFHNEIGWAILSNLLEDYEEKYKNYILYSIYWHHPKHEIDKGKNKKTSYSDSDTILGLLSDNDKNNIIEFYNHITGENKNISFLNGDIKYTPTYIEKEINEKKFEYNFFINGILISADRIVSSNDQYRILTDDNYCKQIIERLYKSNVPDTYDIPKHYNLDRFLVQEKCALDSLQSCTTTIKMPAGGGKTLTGLLAWIKSGRKRKLMWICARNVIAESAYKSILEELNALNINVKVELYLSGKIIKKNYSEYNNGFESDIIITNIDNYLNPNVTNWVRNRMFTIMASDVVFDEFHEFVGEEPLFALFLKEMTIRHKLTNSRTILSSATPTILHRRWDYIDKQTLLLPNKDNHYKAVHNKNIKVNILNDIESYVVKNNSLTITNSIESAQKLAIKKNYPIIAHSNFIEEDKNRILNNLYELYGKTNKGDNDNKLSVISAPIIQAAMDMSFKEMIEIPCSPESTLQRIGRLNRWGEYNEAILNIVYKTDSFIEKNERAAINNRYETKLTKLWVDFLVDNIKSKNYNLTLDDIYEIYNKFLIKYNSEMVNFITNKYTESMNNLSKIYPKRYIEDKNDVDINGNIEIDDDLEEKKQSKGSKLRDTDTDKIFCIYGYANTNKYTKPFYIDLNRCGEVNENDLLKIVKKLSVDKTYNFEYNKCLERKKDKFNSSYLKEISWNERTPFISFDKVYSDKYGIIKKNVLKNIK